MNVQVGDILTIDGVKHIVLTSILDNNTYYSFINEVNDEETEITPNYYLVKINGDGTYTKVTDENEINRLFPKVQDGLKLSMGAYGIDYKSLIESQSNQ
jgi:hypothetical protein